MSQDTFSSWDLKNNSIKSFYIDLSAKAMTVKDDWGLLGGIRLGYKFNQNVKLGVIAYGLIPEHLEESYINRDDRDDLNLGYGGLEICYAHPLNDIFDVTGQLMIGSGRIDIENKNGNDYFFITEPGVSLNYNIVSWFGLGFGTSYRFASGIDYEDYTNASLSGWAHSFDFKFKL